MLWILLLLGACGVVGVMVYNRLVIAQNQYRNAFSQIGVQLQRRHDLIPNLVAAAKGYLKHENDTFTQVTQARKPQACWAAHGRKMQRRWRSFLPPKPCSPKPCAA